jgi:putative tryptophan/tyrosine transport system substrate-binding protein
MKRRELMLLLGGAAIAWPVAARAQQKTMPVIGFISTFSPGPSAAYVAGFRDGIAEAGYTEGRNLAIEYRWAEGRLNRLPAIAQDLVERPVAMIAAVGQAAALAAKAATDAIPIVFYSAADPVATGLVKSLARPGGNLTGIVGFAVTLTPKLLQLLRELVPGAKILGLLIDPTTPLAEIQSSEAATAAQTVGVDLAVVRASSEAELASAFAGLTTQRISGLVVGASSFFYDHDEWLVAAAALHAVPTIYNDRRYAAAGGLISYGNDIAAIYRQVGGYAGKVLNGAKPADLPVQQPTKFELVINLKTAKTLGLTVPQSFLARADEVIE